jgi:uncharacterized membrane protein
MLLEPFEKEAACNACSWLSWLVSCVTVLTVCWDSACPRGIPHPHGGTLTLSQMRILQLPSVDVTFNHLIWQSVA